MNKDLLSDMISEIAVKHSEDPKGEWSEKYGVNIDNDVFMMHRFCWCEREDCGWCGEIGAMPQLMRDCFNAKYKESDRLPNFWYKPLDLKVWWYKYIGRGVEVNKNLSKIELADMFKNCINYVSAER